MSNRNRWTLPGLAAGALVAMLAVPTTRNLLLTQLGVLPIAGNPLANPESAGPATQRRLDAFISKHRDDVPIQVAAAVAAAGRDATPVHAGQERPDPGESAARRLAIARDLTGRLPDSASAHAAAIRILALGGPSVNSDDVRRSLGLPVEDGRSRDRVAACPAGALQFALETARRGETLAPDNAFFPFYEAGWLMTQGRRQESRAAFLRAGRCSSYDDYIRDEAAGRLRITRDGVGQTGVISDLAAAVGILFPHMASARAIARVEQADAEALEKAGDVRAGAEVRLAGMRTGSLMRRDASSAIGNLVGIAITSVMAERLPGDPPEPTDKTGDDSWRKERLERFANHLSRLGRDRDAAWVSREAAAGEETREIIRQGARRVWVPATLAPYLAPFAVGSIALRSAAILLVLGALAGLASMSRGVREGKPLPSPLLAVPAVIVILAVVWGPGVVQGSSIGDAARSIFGPEQAGSAVEGYGVQLAVADSLIPILLLVGLVIWSRSRHIAVSVGVTRAMKALALPLASALVLISAACSVPTLRADRQIREQLIRCTREEGREFARVLGRPWPN